MNKYTKLKSAFPDTTVVKYVDVTPEGRNKLNPTLRWIYSRLLYRYRDRPVSKRVLARITGVDRCRTLPKALVALEKLGLVKPEKSATKNFKYRAVVPTGDKVAWFRWTVLPTGKNKLKYDWAIYSPDRSIIDGLVQAADIFRRYSASLLAARFGVCRQTITAARKRLAGIGLDRPSKAKDNPVVEALKPKPKEPEMTAVEQQTIQQTIKAFEMSGMQGASNAERLAHQHGITEPDTVAMLSRVTATIFKGLAYKEQSQIVGSLVKRFGNGEGLEDYLYGKLPAWTVKYGSGILSVESFLQAM